MQKLTVKNCRDCPFNQFDGIEWPDCFHPFKTVQINPILEPGFPDNCPLLKNGILIEKVDQND